MPEPVFRFWGSRDPRGRSKPPIRAERPPAGDGGDGIATLRLYEPIDSWGGDWGTSAVEFAEALDGLPADTHTVRLHINSPGGEVYEAVAILNMLRDHPARITARVDGLAASAASFIATGAEELVMGENTELMIHDAWGIAIGPAADMHFMGDRLDKLSDNIASIYAAKAGGAVGDWRSAMLAETWYSAAEAVAVGLADSVAAPAAADGGGQAEDFDRGMFKHRNRAAARLAAGLIPVDEIRPEGTGRRAETLAARRAARHAARAARLSG